MSQSCLTPILRQATGAFYVTLLAALVSTAQQDDSVRIAQTIQTVTGSVMHSNFKEALAYRPSVTHISQRDVAQPRIDPRDRNAIPQAPDPALECRAFDHVDYSSNVNHS